MQTQWSTINYTDPEDRNAVQQVVVKRSRVRDIVVGMKREGLTVTSVNHDVDVTETYGAIDGTGA